MMKSELGKARSKEEAAGIEAHFVEEKASIKQEMEKRLEAVRGEGKG